MPPRRRSSDRTPFGITKERVETVIAGALMWVCGYIWNNSRAEVSAAEKITAIGEFREQQVHSRDREIDDLQQRVLRLEGVCK